MYSNDHSYLFTSFAPDEIQEKVLRIRQTLGVLPYVGGKEKNDVITKNFAHVTLKGGFSLKEHFTQSDLLKKVETLSFPPLHLIAKKHETYDTKDLGVIIVLKVEPDIALQKLHMQIQDFLQGNIENKDPNFIWEKEQYTPHLSVIYYLDPMQKAQAIKLVEEILPLPFTLDSLLFLGNNPGVRHTRKILKEIHADNDSALNY